MFSCKTESPRNASDRELKTWRRRSAMVCNNCSRNGGLTDGRVKCLSRRRKEIVGDGIDRPFDEIGLDDFGSK